MASHSKGAEEMECIKDEITDTRDEDLANNQFPEMLSVEEITNTLKKRTVLRENERFSDEKDYLVELFKKFVIPLPQRHQLRRLQHSRRPKEMLRLLKSRPLSGKKHKSDSPLQPNPCTAAKMKRIETQQGAKERDINSDSEIMKGKQQPGFVRLLTKKPENLRKPIKLKRKRSNSKQDEQKKDPSMSEQCDEECAVAKKSCPTIKGDDNIDSFESINAVTRTDNNETTNSVVESR